MCVNLRKGTAMKNKDSGENNGGSILSDSTSGRNLREAETEGKKADQFKRQEQRIKILEGRIQELHEALLQLERRQRFPTFLSIKELTDMLPVSERTVYDWVSRGSIPYHKAGDRTLFLLDEILKWTKRQSNDFQSLM